MTESQRPEEPKSEEPAQRELIHSPGAELARARRARRISLEAAARELKLPRSVLEHIESDRFEQIAPIYRRGYIVNYARLAGIDPEPLIDCMGSLEPAPLRPVLPVASHPRRFDRFLKLATYALVTTMIVPPLVYFFVLGGARLFESEMVSGGGPEGSTVVDQGKPGYRERLAEALAVQPLENTRDDDSHLSASALPMKPVRSSSPAEPDEDAQEKDTSETVAETDALSSLALALSDDSWVEIESADGQRLEFDLLRAGESRQYSGQAPFRVLLGRAAAVELTLDGSPVAFAGQEQAGVAELLIGQAAGSAEPATGGGSQMAE